MARDMVCSIVRFARQYRFYRVFELGYVTRVSHDATSASENGECTFIQEKINRMVGTPRECRVHQNPIICRYNLISCM